MSHNVQGARGMSITENIVEDAALAIFADLGYTYAGAGQIAPDGTAPERAAYSDVILIDRLSATVERLNPHVPAEARAEAIKLSMTVEPGPHIFAQKGPLFGARR
jgi:type I restriction enzyme R subunit